MKKDNVKWLWTTGWGAASWFAKRWTRTPADDMFCSAMLTDQMFEDFWQLLVTKGWAQGAAVNVAAVQKHVEQHSGLDVDDGVRSV